MEKTDDEEEVVEVEKEEDDDNKEEEEEWKDEEQDIAEAEILCFFSEDPCFTSLKDCGLFIWESLAGLGSCIEKEEELELKSWVCSTAEVMDAAARAGRGPVGDGDTERLGEGESSIS